ncbi:olfactory receptor-like protein DTMT [Stegastes partitus]|uniref:Olfactory receptor n=1 Tax=Stegastes partitus TaxID=144197 RepID=A0A9Y4NU19_9TELE|nr:PREDICTED: olfactory receptor-like protein DTMT [Stegastes partitus]
MDHELNVTYITLDGYVEVNKYRHVYFAVMLAAYVLILCSNFTILCIIVSHTNLHEPMYVFIAALLINSVLYSTMIYPKLLTDVLSKKQVISYQTCLFQWFLYYFLGGSEFFLLAAMAYDRYVSICKPLQYPTIMTKTAVGVFLLLAWLLPVCMAAVPIVLSANTKLCSLTFKGIICSSAVQKLHCVKSVLLRIYGLVALGANMLFPVLFIAFTYARIFIISYRSCREVWTKAAQTCLPHLLVLIYFSCLVTFDVLIVRLDANFPKSVRLIMALQTVVCHPLFNPVIYGLKMKEINKHLKSLLRKMVKRCWTVGFSCNNKAEM